MEYCKNPLCNEINGGIDECIKPLVKALNDAAEKLATGLNKIEKAANFDKLERYVEAMERLATLEKSGKLEKIAGALR